MRKNGERCQSISNPGVARPPHFLLGEMICFLSGCNRLTGNSVVTGFLLVTAFVPPGDDTPYATSAQGYEWYIIPTVGWGGLLLGGLYFVVFRYVVPQVKGKQLVVDRVPIIVSDDHGGFVQKHEIVRFSWGVSEEMSDYELK